MTRKDANRDTAATAPNSWPRAANLKTRLSVALASLAIIGACVAVRAIGGREEAGAQAPQPRPATHGTNPAPAQSGVASSKQQVVAMVNGEEIQRNDLAQESLARFGKEVLESLMNKYLIMVHCQQLGITVSRQEIDDEIARLAKKFSIPVDQWLQMLKTERGIKPEQYAQDIIWPTIALRKIAADATRPTEAEIDEAYEAQFGPAVKARLIVLEDGAKAAQVHAQAKANPGEFGNLARKHSVDPNSASLNGLIQPIRRFVGDPAIEKEAFSLQENQISRIVEVNNQFAILLCEGRTAPAGITKNQVRSRLEEFVREKKMRGVSADVFKELQSKAQVVNVFNNPARKAEFPGVAATINGQTITVRQLSEECISRHGEEVLEQMIHRKLLEQELKKRKLAVSQRELDAEVGRAALAAGKLLKNGQPDIDAWLKIVTEEQGVPLDKYVREAVWPSAALKLVAGKVEITEDEIQRGFVANYGAKAKVRAIVLDSQRRAQEVWQLANDNPSVEHFGKLAEQYSVEAASRANVGRVPPIQQHGGQPALEKEAFRLKPGEVSGIVQIMEKFVILYLEAFTEPVQVSAAEVRELIYEDIHEKKQRMAMTREFDRLKEQAKIDNFLAGTSHSPAKKTATAPKRDSKLPASGVPGGAVPAGFNGPPPLRK